MPDIATATQLRQRLNALRVTRIQFREVLADPLRRAMYHRVPLVAAQRVWDLPTEAAAAGFQLTTLQDQSGWHVTLTRAIDDETELHTAGDASSLLKALFQLVDATEQRIGLLESECRRELERGERAAEMAA